MIDSNFMLGGIISVIYFLLKFIEMRFIVKENKPLKLLFRDTLVVYIGSILGLSIYSQFNNLSSIESQPEVFTNDPSF
tara:strand:+ start:307 stop:540 length:234 start_codon:yes stop_codon:yes gene_type:complete